MPASATRLGLLCLNARQEDVREREGLLEAPAPTSDPTLSASGLVADRDPRVAPRMSKVDRDPGRGQQKASPQPHRVNAVARPAVWPSGQIAREGSPEKVCGARRHDRQSIRPTGMARPAKMQGLGSYSFSKPNLRRRSVLAFSETVRMVWSEKPAAPA